MAGAGSSREGGPSIVARVPNVASLWDGVNDGVLSRIQDLACASFGLDSSRNRSSASDSAVSSGRAGSGKHWEDIMLSSRGGSGKHWEDIMLSSRGGGGSGKHWSDSDGALALQDMANASSRVENSKK